MIDVQQRRAADAWFLDHGLPAVLRPGRLVRRLWPRSAPALAAFAVFMVNSAVVVLVTGKYTINIEGEPTRTEWFVLALLVLVLPIASLVGWLVSRIDTVRGRTIAAGVALVAAVVGGFVGGPSHLVLADLIFEAIVIAAILALTASGLGSILSWTARMTLSHLTAIGSLMVRALPVLLLTFLVFFNSPVWLMAAVVTRTRMWLAIILLSLIAAAFVVAVTIDRFKPVLLAPDTTAGRNDQLADTPFSAMPDPSEPQNLTRMERLNVMFVLAVSQLAHILVVAFVTALIFFVLGLILLSPEVLAAWTRNGSSDGTFLGMTIPVPEALIHVTMFLGALTFMYVSARAAGDGEYRTQFLDPLSDDLRLTLVARGRYRAAVPAS
jgi:MFS family permease